MDSVFRIVFLGPPGSGKGTQAAELNRELKLPIIGAGDLLRRVSKEDTPVGHQVADCIDNGNLAPIPVTVEMIKQEIARIGQNGFILDGFPRNMEQVKLFGDVPLTHALEH